MRVKPGIYYLIFNALVEDNRENKDRFVDMHTLLELMFGNGVNYWTKLAYNETEKQVKQNMFMARKVAEENGLMIVTKRKPTELDPTIKHQAIGWKIANGGSETDATALINEIHFRERLRTNLEMSKTRIQLYAKQKGLFDHEEGMKNQIAMKNA